VMIPLCGPTGASALFGPQKGATPAVVAELDAALAHYAEIIERDLGIAIRDVPGAGSAGGLGAGLMVFLNATMRSGAEMILKAMDFEERVKGADLVITGEGQIDTQTAHGKTIGVVATLAKQQGCPVVAVTGALGRDHERVYDLGIDAVVTLPDAPMTLDYAMTHADRLASQAAEGAVRLFCLGKSIA
jgi:glycerate 2-kinase